MFFNFCTLQACPPSTCTTPPRRATPPPRIPRPPRPHTPSTTRTDRLVLCLNKRLYRGEKLPQFPFRKMDHWWNNFFTWSQHKIVILMANLCHFDWVCIIGKLILPPCSIKPYFCDYYIMNTLEVLPPVSAITLEYRCGSHAFGKLWEVSKTDHWAAFSWKLFLTHVASPASTVIIHPSILRVGYFQDDIAITLW